MGEGVPPFKGEVIGERRFSLQSLFIWHGTRGSAVWLIYHRDIVL